MGRNQGQYARNPKHTTMSEITNPPAGVGEAARDESYEAYEARFLAGDTADGKEPEPSDATGSAEEQDSKTAVDSETADDNEQDDDEPQEPGDKPKKGKGGFQRKIDKLNGRIHELETQLAGTPTKVVPAVQPTETVIAPPAVADTAKPKLEDFDSIEQWGEALTDWKLEAKDRERTAAAQQEAAQREAQALIGAWNNRVTAAKAAHPEYDRVIESVKDVSIPAAQQRLIIQSEHGAEIAFALASDPEQLKKFAAMNDPIQAAKYFGALEGALEAKLSPQSARNTDTPATRAPRPPSQVGARGSAAVDPFDPAAGDDYTRWERARNAQLHKRAA